MVSASRLATEFLLEKDIEEVKQKKLARGE
jgi:hypothetical protein